MACCGKNHSFNCSCGFGARAYDSDELYVLTPPNAQCRECNAWVYFRRSSNGGGTYFDSLQNWKRHSCTDRRWRYSPFNNQGQPKLRNKRTGVNSAVSLPVDVREIRENSGNTDYPRRLERLIKSPQTLFPFSSLFTFLVFLPFFPLFCPIFLDVCSTMPLKLLSLAVSL